MMRRFGLRDDQWERIKDLLPGREGSAGVTAADNRLFVEAVLCRYRTGMPWRDLPERFGDGTKVHLRFSRWAKSGVWERVFTGPSPLLRADPSQSAASVLSPRGFCRLCFSLGISGLVPAVPRKSLCPTHAPFTPAATRPVIRSPADLSQQSITLLVSTTSVVLTTRLRRVHFRSSFGHSPAQGRALDFSSDAHHRGSLPQQLRQV